MSMSGLFYIQMNKTAGDFIVIFNLLYSTTNSILTLFFVAPYRKCTKKLFLFTALWISLVWFNVHLLRGSLTEPESGTHTQAIESLWQKYKCRHKKEFGTARSLFQSYVSGFVWRRKFDAPDIFSTCGRNYVVVSV
uniref:Uncharacterized protein n=1 Tax=Ditylenchus dipsaci TaxID=166011 RepID=A0A915DA90_9BILA